MELSFPSELGYEIVARDAVAAFARCLGIDKSRVEDIKTALSEACINAIEHGNLFDANLRVKVICNHNGNYLTVDVRDQGMKEYTAGGKPLTIEEKLAGLGPLRGIGLMLITELSDGAEFVPVSQGNCFRLTFHSQPSATTHESSV
jgi:serine/threonine-protein kinase RsbW